MNERRRFLVRTCQLAALPGLAGGPARLLHAAPLLRTVISVPGPGNLLYLPITLAGKIGADAAEGLTLDIRYTGGGPQSFRALLERNADFAAGGLAALALQRLNGKPVVCIVPTTRVPAYTLLVRNGLKGKVRKVADLQGMVVGVKGHVPGGRSTSQLFAEYVLQQAGLPPDRVNYVAAGQSYDSQHAALASGTVDAVMADEPFATRLVKHQVAYVLGDYHDPEATRRLLGGLFLNGMLATREDLIASQPELVEKVVKMLRRTLVWINGHSAREMVDALGLSDEEERVALLGVLQLRKNIYSPDGRISAQQLATVERFLHATEPASARGFSLRSMVDARWAGEQP